MAEPRLSAELTHMLSLGEIAEAYDSMADGYDAEYATLQDIAEDEHVHRLLVMLPLRGPACDLGCGTGKFCELLPGLAKDTIGFDLSERMLEHARAKFPRAQWVNADMFEATGEYNTVVSLFGSPSYEPFSVVLDLVWRLLRPGGRCFLMPLAPGRLESTRDVPASRHATYTPEEDAGTEMFLRGFQRVRTELLNNRFVIATGMRPAR